MAKLILLAAFVALFEVGSVLSDGGAHNWDYDEKTTGLDPQDWHKQYPACGGKRQSPIDVVDKAIKRDLTLKPLKFINYDKALTNLVMKNDGHTLRVEVPKSYDVRLESASLPASYRLTQFHFHWPSEHTFNGQEYPLELHLVHTNTKYEDADVANHEDGIVVVAVLFEYNKGPFFSYSMYTLVQHMASTVSEGQTFTIPDEIFLEDLLPKDRSYVRYGGSLTTPGCAEVVDFHILTSTMAIAKHHVAKFTGLRHQTEALMRTRKGNEAYIVHNDRPTQPLNGRTVRQFGSLGDLPIAF